MLRYTDPITKKRKHKATTATTEKEAQREAALLEVELNSGRHKPATELCWAEFREIFEDKYLRKHSDGSFSVYQSAFNQLEDITGVAMLRDVSNVLTDYIGGLHEQEKSPNTIQTYMKHIRVALYWAADEGYLAERPKVKVPKGTDDSMKGRAIEPAEFQQMLIAVDDVIPEYAEQWRHYLTGLWLSGLRRAESLILSWDKSEPFHIDQTGLYWRFRIRASAQKSRKSQFCPMAPDLIQWLQETTPAVERTGKVFEPVGFKGALLTGSEAGRMISRIGKAAEVETDPENERFATCHDFRRSFGTRWASKLMPADLTELMRHRSIETTMKYYVSQESDALSARLHAAFSEKEVTKKVTI